MISDSLGFLPAQPDRRLLRRAAQFGRTEPLWAGGPRILSDPQEITQHLRSGSLTKDYPRALALQRTEGFPALRRVVEAALFLLDPPEHGQLRAALNPLHVDPAQMHYRVRLAVLDVLDTLPIGESLDASIDVGIPAAVAVVGAMFNIAVTEIEGFHLARTSKALNCLAAIDVSEPVGEDDERSARALRKAVRGWLSAESFTVGSSVGSAPPGTAEVTGDRFIDLVQFLAATAIETVSTTVIAGLAADIDADDVRILFAYAATAPLLPYTLHLPHKGPEPVLLNVGHTHPFGVGRHHCVGANIASLVAETTLSWVATKAVEVRGELAWRSDRLGRTLDGTMLLAPTN